MKLLSLLLLSGRGLVQVKVRAQQNAEQCSDAELNAYISCVAANPCLCSNCDPDPIDDDPEIVLQRPPDSCQDVSRVFCPLIKCCSACEEEAAAWYSCTFAGFSQSTLGQDCPQNCPGYGYSDVEGDCEEPIVPDEPATAETVTPEPTAVPEPSVCETEMCGNATTSVAPEPKGPSAPSQSPDTTAEPQASVSSAMSAFCARWLLILDLVGIFLISVAALCV